MNSTLEAVPVPVPKAARGHAPLPTTGIRAAPVNEVNVDRHGGEQAPSEPVAKPSIGSSFTLDEGVIQGKMRLK